MGELGMFGHYLVTHVFLLCKPRKTLNPFECASLLLVAEHYSQLLRNLNAVVLKT